MAFACWFRVLFDGNFAARVRAAWVSSRKESPAGMPTGASGAAATADEAATGGESPLNREPGSPARDRSDAALQLLGLMQREGRLVDFLQQDLTGFSDADVGSAARVVHEGCRRALQSRATITPCRTEAEGAQVTLPTGFDAHLVKISGNLAGEPPYRGVLRHGGWRVQALELPELVGDANPEIIQPAEVEL
jgi:hypothetical protein